MKKFGSSLYHTLVCALFSTAFFACEKSKETSLKNTESHSKHAWEWIPDNEELLVGKEIYVAECAMCHEEGEEQAPKLGKALEWNEREAQPIDVIIQKAITGFIGEDGEMPAKGGSDYLTDVEVAAAVKFMINTPKH